MGLFKRRDRTVRSKAADRRTVRLEELQAKRDELARLVEAETNPAKKERGRVELARFDRRIARATEKPKRINPVVLWVIFQAISAFLQWWLSSSSF